MSRKCLAAFKHSFLFPCFPILLLLIAAILTPNIEARPFEGESTSAGIVTFPGAVNYDPSAANLRPQAGVPVALFGVTGSGPRLRWTTPKVVLIAHSS